MNKEKIINDQQFIKKCSSFGLDYSDFEIKGNLIVLKTPVDNLYLFLDSHYNIVTIEECFTQPTDNMCEQIYYGYENFTDEVPYGIGIGYPFDEFTLKQIVDISSRVNTIVISHGHSMEIAINGEWYENDPNNHYLQLISYIKFLAEEINIYWENTYSLRMLGFDVPDIYSYLRNIINKINECININLKNNRRPHPVDIISYIGQTINYNQKESRFDGLLYNVIDLLMRVKGMKAVAGTFDQIECISEKEKLPSLSVIAPNLLKILEVSEQQVIENRERSLENRTDQKVKFMEPWLFEDIDE